MITNNYQKFDTLLSHSDFDSMDWNDGHDQEIAVTLLEKFTVDDWGYLSEVWSEKERLWRGCLVSSLSPNLGSKAQNLLISAIEDPDPEVAFLALSAVSFYCGVNDGADGPFEDRGILNNEFKIQVRNTYGITDRIQSISQECAPFLQARFNLLSKILSK